jgi:hypothetical protein
MSESAMIEPSKTDLLSDILRLEFKESGSDRSESEQFLRARTGEVAANAPYQGMVL